MSWIASQPTLKQQIIDALPSASFDVLPYFWELWARPDQLPPPGGWFLWFILGGRGSGKTRTGAEWVRSRVERGVSRRIALINDTASDTRRVMIEGPSGVLNVCPPWNRPTYNPTKKELVWPRVGLPSDGAVAYAYSAEAPQELRGPEHDTAWMDEPAKWRNLRKTDEHGGSAIDNLMFGLRVGRDPRGIMTTTPRPLRIIKDIINRPSTVLTTSSTYDNRAHLSPRFFEQVVDLYEGSRLGRQEIHAELIEDLDSALWKRLAIDADRVHSIPRGTNIVRIVVAIDPAARKNMKNAEVGIIVAALCTDSKVYIIEDLSDQLSPAEWSGRAVAAYHRHKADRIVAEINNGGDMVEYTIKVEDPNVAFKSITATRGKRTRAEPIAALYDKHVVRHVGHHALLEDQMCQWDPNSDESPDRLDAMVWAVTELKFELVERIASGRFGM